MEEFFAWFVVFFAWFAFSGKSSHTWKWQHFTSLKVEVLELCSLDFTALLSVLMIIIYKGLNGIRHLTVLCAVENLTLHTEFNA